MARGWKEGKTIFNSIAAMSEQHNYTTHLLDLLRRWKADDASAVEELIVHSHERLHRMAGRMLKANPHVRRWLATDDVRQNALMRLYRSLKDVKPDSIRAFNGLMATQIRRELIDMARSLYGPEGYGGHHGTQPDGSPPDPPAPETGPMSLLAMAEFHERVGKLVDEEREVFELIFYQGMTQLEAAAVLEVSERTIKRRWRQARLSLKRILDLGE